VRPLRSLGILPAAIPAHDLDTRMLLSPGRNRVSGAVGQEIHHPVPLEIHDDRPIGPALPEGKVVHGENRRRRGMLDLEAPDMTKEGLPTDGASTMTE